MYTRHIYRLDEVKAALQYSIHKKNVNESIFWAKELYDSEEFDCITEVLFVSWFYSIGIGNIEVLHKILTTNIQDENEFLNLVYAMTVLKDSMRNCTLPIVFMCGLGNFVQTNYNVYFQMPGLLKQENPKVDTFIRTTLLGKYIYAWKQYIQLDKKDYELLKNISVIKHNNIEIIDLLEQLNSFENVPKLYIDCTIICILCTHTSILEAAKGNMRSIDNDIHEKIKMYNTIIGRKKRRIYEIPKLCLYGKTKRGTMTYDENNLHELYDPEYIIENSNVIESLTNLYGSYEAFTEDIEQLDKFNDWYFPDDIPDEWSLEYQKKSHGFGVNQKTDKPLLRRYLSRWIDLKSSCFIWDKEIIVSRLIEQIHNLFDDFYFDKKILKLYSNTNDNQHNKDIWDMKNIKLILNTLE